MATEDKLNMSLDAMIAKSSKSHANKKAGGRKITGAGRGPGAKAPGSGGKKIGNGMKNRSLGVSTSKGPVQKRTSAPRRPSGPNPNHFLDREVDIEPGESRDHASRPRIQPNALQQVEQHVKGPEAPGKWGHSGFAEMNPSRRTTSSVKSRIDTGFKLKISNLDNKVSDDDIMELFKEFGKVKHAAVSVNATGRSKGATVTYFNKVHALAAQKKYNKVCLDGKPMLIELVTPQGGDRRVEALSSGIRIGDVNGGSGSGRLVTAARGGRGGGMRSAQGAGRGSRGGSRAYRGTAAMDED